MEVKRRMRQVELEMTKLRARQAEVSKEVQKTGSSPGKHLKEHLEFLSRSGGVNSAVCLLKV